MTQAMITQAAIKHTDGTVYTLPRPARHHHLIRLMADEGLPTPIIGEQGFVDDEGRFLERKEAAALAIEAGQIEALNWPPYLYSEDLW